MLQTSIKLQLHFLAKIRVAKTFKITTRIFTSRINTNCKIYLIYTLKIRVEKIFQFKIRIFTLKNPSCEITKFMTWGFYRKNHYWL